MEPTLDGLYLKVLRRREQTGWQQLDSAVICLTTLCCTEVWCGVTTSLALWHLK